MTTYLAEFAGGADINAHAGDYERPGLEVNRVPKATIVVRDEDGSEGDALPIGTVVNLKRDGTTEFPGIVSRRKRISSPTAENVEAELLHRGYRELQRWDCDAYVFDEDGDPLTTRDAVLVNPWAYHIFRAHGGTLDGDGNEPAVDGVPIDVAARCLIGTRLVVQHDYHDNTPFLPSLIYASTNKVQVYADVGDDRPKLQRVRKDNAGFLAGQAIESIPLENGDPDVKAMGTISTVAVILIGELSGSQHPTIRVCRNARAGTRVYTSITLTPTSNYLGSGLTAWQGSVDLSADGAAATTSLGYEITIPGSDADAATTKVHYIKLTATTTADTSVTEGTIETYDDPHTSAAQDLWVDDDFKGMRRADALERLRLGTIADSTVNPNPHWDMWVDDALAFHFAERRGALTTTNLSQSDKNLTVLEQEQDASMLGYQVTAVMGGRGQAERILVDRTAFTSGGLYDAMRDPASGALYGDLPGVVVYRDQSVTTIPELRRRARAFMALIRDPRTFYRVQVPGFKDFDDDVGDEVLIDHADWSLADEAVRVTGIKRVWDGSKEDLQLTLGEKVADAVRNLRQAQTDRTRADRASIPVTQQGGISGPGVYFDKDRYGRFAFGIPDGVEVERVVLKLTTLPWQATSKTAASGGSSSPTSDAASHTHTGQNAAAAAHDHGAEVSGGESATHTHKFADHVSSTPGGWALEKYLDGAGTGYDLGVVTTGTDLHTFSANVGHTHTVDIASGGSHTHTVDISSSGSHSHTVTIDPHTHALTFGIFQFGGDAVGDSATPLFGKDIQFAVDPTVNAVGEPTAFSTDRHPAKFGARTAPTQISVDVTGYLTILGNGKVAPGEHTVYFLGAVDTDNAQGLAVVSVTPIIKLKEAQGT